MSNEEPVTKKVKKPTKPTVRASNVTDAERARALTIARRTPAGQQAPKVYIFNQQNPQQPVDNGAPKKLLGGGGGGGARTLAQKAKAFREYDDSPSRSEAESGTLEDHILIFEV